MTVNTVTTEEALGWLGTGWRLFVLSKAMWILLTVAYLVLAIVLNMIPLIGPLVYALIAPALYGGLILGAHALSGGRNLRFWHLFEGLSDVRYRMPLIALGALLLLAQMLIVLVAMSVAVGGGMAALGLGGEGGAGAQLLTGGMLLVLLVAIVLGLLLLAAFIYSAPLVIFAREGALDALALSVKACFSNIVPMLVVGVVYLIIAIIAVIPFGLGLLILLPVTFGAIYASYVSLFGAPQPA